jgi:hypothetical protein
MPFLPLSLVRHEGRPLFQTRAPERVSTCREPVAAWSFEDTISLDEVRDNPLLMTLEPAGDYSVRTWRSIVAPQVEGMTRSFRPISLQSKQRQEDRDSRFLQRYGIKPILRAA